MGVVNWILQEVDHASGRIHLLFGEKKRRSSYGKLHPFGFIVQSIRRSVRVKNTAGGKNRHKSNKLRPTASKLRIRNGNDKPITPQLRSSLSLVIVYKSIQKCV